MAPSAQASGRRLGFRKRFRAGLARPGAAVALVAGLCHGLYDRQAIEVRGVLVSVLSGVVLGLVWLGAWLLIRALLTKVIDLSRPAVMLGYLGGMLLVGAVVVSAIDGDPTYLRDYPFIAITAVVWVAATVGGLPGMLLGQIIAWVRDARRTATNPVAQQAPAAEPEDTVPARPAPFPPMPLIGHPNPRGPLDDVTGRNVTNDSRDHPGR